MHYTAYATHPTGEARVAVLVDCDNTTPEILDYALRVSSQFGRVVLRRGYGNHVTLAKTWQEALVEKAFTRCLQFQYAAGKDTSHIALALDVFEAMFDSRPRNSVLSQATPISPIYVASCRSAARQYRSSARQGP